MNYKHGLRNTRFFRIWIGIRQRCTDPKRHNYKEYGGRGIKCEWNTFEDFRNDMHQSYIRHALRYGEANTSINRKNNDGNYSKLNCEWSTWVEQCLNKRSSGSHFYYAYGTRRTLRQWAASRNLRLKTLRDRLNAGWPLRKALRTPIHVLKSHAAGRG